MIQRPNAADNWVELGNPPGEIVIIDETNSYEPPMTDELRETIRKALTKKRPPDNPPSPNAS